MRTLWTIRSNGPLVRTLVLICLVGAAGVMAGPAKATQDPVAVLKESDSGKTVALKRGQTVAIELPSQPGTGFGWYIAPDAESLFQIVENREITSTGVPGGAVVHRIVVQPRQTGDLKLVLHYKRVWERGVPPVKTFEATLRVAE